MTNIIDIDDKLRHVLVAGESRINCATIIQQLIADDIKNNIGLVYINPSPLSIDNLITKSDNSKNIIKFTVNKPFDVNEEIYKIKQINLRALMDNGKVFVVIYNPIITKEDQTKLNKLILETIIQDAFARIDGKEYDNNHELIDKKLINEAGKKRKPFYIYIEDCYQYLTREVMVALEEIRLKKVGMIFGLSSDGNIEEGNPLIMSLLANTGSKFIFKSNPKDIQALRLNPKNKELTRNEYMSQIMNRGTKTTEIKNSL